MVAATFLWGATFVVIRDSLDALSPVAIVFVRFTAAAVLFAPWVIARRRAAGGGWPWGVGLVTGLLTAGGYLFQAIGLMDVRAGTSAFLTCSGTLLAGWLAWPVLGQRPTSALVVGMVVAAMGSALLGEGSDGRLGAGDVWTLAGAALYALQIVAVARWGRSAEPATLAALQCVVVAVVLAPFTISATVSLADLPAADWARLAYLAIAGSMLAPWLQLRAQRSLPPGRIGMLFALEPVFGLIVAMTLGGERFAGRWWWGAALIVIAVTWVEWVASRPRPTIPAPNGGSG
jgi:drug/metabolite transporter (DMT)-like permease